MEVIVSGRHCHVSDDVRAQVEDRLSGVEKLKDRVQRAEVVFTAQGTKGPKDQAMTCEITLRAKGPVVRAVGQAEDKICLLYTSPSPRDQRGSRMPSSA